MPTPVIIALAVGAPVLFLLAVWLFAIAPRAQKKKILPFLRPYAHRGLFGEEIPENSLAAFDRAASNGFAIELDVQLSADGVVMVFHDYTLKRMCGIEGKVCDLTADELTKTPLIGGEGQTVPTLAQVLQTVAGRTPLLIELKGESGNTDLVPALFKTLEGYTGEYCMESFNPLLLRAVKKYDASVVRGLLSTNLIKSKKPGSKLTNFLLTHLLLCFMCRPAFHAWDIKYPNILARRLGTSLLGAASMVFTVKDEALYDELLSKGIYPIFDSFVPGGKTR